MGVIRYAAIDHYYTLLHPVFTAAHFTDEELKLGGIKQIPDSHTTAGPRFSPYRVWLQCSLLPQNLVLPLGIPCRNGGRALPGNPISGAFVPSRPSLSQISGCPSPCNIKATCASSQRIFLTLDSATSPQPGHETSGDKIYFYFQEVICLPLS